MSGFKPLNLESDDESDVEIDDTKELQIEDALKLYQTALKYHAEGPDSFDHAAEAYEELFQSEIFHYPESQTELRRIELYGPLPETEDLWEDGVQAGAVVAPSGIDSGPSTLPQILHLSHKNYAQFKLEYLDARLQYLNYSLDQIRKDASDALDHFVHALDKDDSDLDLWRRTATVGGILDSKRVARFCLEAVLDGDDEGLGTVLALPGLDEGLAAEQLRNVVGQLQDELSVLQAPLSANNKRRMLSKMLKQRLNPYEGIDGRRKLLRESEGPRRPPSPRTAILKAPKTWADLGNALLERQRDEQNGAGPKDAGVGLSFDMSSVTAVTAKASDQPEDEQTSETMPTHLLGASQREAASQQFPGLDEGRPTTQPQIRSANDDGQTMTRPGDDTDLNMDEAATISLPTRKRSLDAAGLGDGTEEGRTKSKRTRTRESGIGEDSRQTLEDANRRWEQDQKLGEMQAADDWMFETVGNLFERIGVVGFEAGKNVRQELQSSEWDSDNAGESEQASRDGLQIAKADLQAFLNNFSNKLAQVLTASGEQLDSPQSSGTPGYSGGTASLGASKTMARKLPAMPDDGLYELLQNIDQDRPLLDEVACMWVGDLLRPPPSDSSRCDSSYMAYQWSEDLKTMVVRVLVNFDEPLIKHAAAELDSLKTTEGDMEDEGSLAVMVQTIFELHLDIYCLIKQPNSGVDLDTIASQKDRLFRWSELAREAMHLRVTTTSGGLDATDELNLRFLWATTFHIGSSDDASQEHVIETMQDLRAIFVAADDVSIQLQNNAVMPELSTAALDREISRLTTKDFFLKVTSQDVSDPVAVIESLEPLLAALDEEPQSEGEDDENSTPPAAPSASPDLVSFLRSSDNSIRLMLWLRLRDAYLAIDYKPMVVSCYFKILRMLLKELAFGMSNMTSLADRQAMAVKTLRQARIVVKKVMELIQSSEIAFECIDEEGLKTAVSSLGQVLQMTQVFNVFEDSIRVAQIEPPKGPNGGDNSSFNAATKSVHETQVHVWIILYRLFGEAIFQFHDLYPTPAEDRFDFLRTVHRNLGLRHICGESNRAFAQLLKNEFFQMTHVDGYDSEQAQVLYDLYGINCFLNPSYELIEHHCTRDAFIDRGVAMQAVDLLIQQASKLPMKELIKHPLKDTIDKVHGSAPRKKPTDAILRNREIYRTFLRSPINPLDLYSCLKGERNQLDVSPVPKEDAVLASKGWYFLMGHIALAKFRSVKRTGPTPTEDVDIAIAFFNQDLEYSGENWETWFRLAQAYDTKIEESVVWSAEKLNSSMSDVVQLQRAAIHCYTMATALAYRSADLRFETSEKMTELFTDFATRIYASSREPFGMKPFELEDADKFLSYTRGVARGKPFQPLRPFTAWKFAKALLQRALAGKPQSWQLHYMLGKCLWKMHVATNLGSRDKRPAAQQVLTSFIRAIEFIPDPNKRDSREKREPTLEPHYKLVSVVHKLMSRGHIALSEAKEALGNTPYARTVAFPRDHDEWVPHILTVLKNLRAADKSNWHHRMIARAAHIIYEDADPRAGGVSETNNLGAMGAKHELTQQMFTKTMVLQVWRPECERAGRHFVYTARYTRFFVRILEQLKDRANLEMLARRVRRRPHDLFEHASVWQDICSAYLRLLRSYAALPEGLETSTFSNIAHEDFLTRKEPLEKWMHTQETGTSAALDVLREVQELKKINQSLMKPGPIDDLIGDSYAYLFNTTGKQLWDDERRIKQEEEARKPPPVASPTRNPMMSLTHLMNIDGASDPPPPPSAAPAPSQPPTEPSVRRKIGVGRREIRTTAESCFQKSKPTSTGHEVTYKGQLPRVQVVIDNSRIERLGDVSVETSAPGSVHDSADDESELSELEEEGDDEGEERPRPLFPGLVSEGQSRQGSEGFETAEEGEGEEGAIEMVEGAAENAGNGDEKMEG